MKALVISCTIFAFSFLAAPLSAATSTETTGDSIVNGYVVYPDFYFIFQPEYRCNGDEPQGGYRYLQCRHCDNWFVTQPFGHNGVTYCNVYADSECASPYSSTGYHNSLPLEPVDICPCKSILLNDAKK